MTKQRTGKLPAAMLAKLLARYGDGDRAGVIVGPKVGVDAAAVRTPEGVLVLASDPLTYAAENIGRYAVHVNANDVFACGAEPVWFLADVLLPPGRADLAEEIFAQIHAACGEVGALLVGGHTEMTPDLPRPMVAGFMIGRAVGGEVLTADRVRPGDAIVLTKGVAIEGTAVIAGEFEASLGGRVAEDVIGRSRGLLERPGLSVGPEARIAMGRGVRAMHDPTEGGVLNGLWEMAEASGVELHVDAGRIAVLDETRAVCGCLGLDPLKLLASGALLVACGADAADGLVEALGEGGIPARRIGEARQGPPGVVLAGGGAIRQSVPDEILKMYEEA